MQSVEEVLADWQRETPDISISAFGPILRALRFASLVGRFESRVLDPFEIGPGEYAALSALRRAGVPYRLNASLLASRAELSSGGLTKMLKRLETKGLVEREADPDDGRGTRVVLTRRGLELQGRVLRAFVAAAENRLGDLAESERRAYDQALKDWSEALDH
jgi:DNA-binding MarR family transcriptional regulator